MSNAYPSPMHSDGLPPLATLQRYLDGELDAVEEEALEARMAEDPFLADAVEGLRAAGGREVVSDRLARIRSGVAAQIEALPPADIRQSKRKGRVKPFPQYLAYTAIAASFALLFAFVLIMREQGSSDAAPAQSITSAEQPPARRPEAVAPPPVLDSADESTAPDPLQEEGEPADVAEARELEAELEQIAAAEAARDRRTPRPIPEETAIESELEAVALAEETFTDEWAADASDYATAETDEAGSGANEPVGQASQGAPAMTAPPAQPSAPQRKEVSAVPSRERILSVPIQTESTQTSRQSRRNQAAPSADYSIDELPKQPSDDAQYGALSKAQHLADLLTEARARYERQQPDSALVLLEEVLLSEPDNVTASFLKGIILMERGDAREAVAWLEQATTVPNAPTFAEAQWQLAQAYVQAGKQRKARRLLQTIGEENGPYQYAAQELLDSLD